MTSRPTGSEPRDAAAARRAERLAAALRENLKRRKAQARGRAKPAEPPPSAPKPGDD